MATKVEPGPGFIEIFDVAAEIGNLEARKPWPQGLTSELLLKTPDLRLVLIAMESGAKMHEHHADGQISVHLLRGRIRMHIQGARSVELAVGQLLALDRSIMHDVEALADSAFLLTIAWPKPPELVAMPHRGY